MITLTISVMQVELFLFIFLRVSAMTLTVPVFDNRNIPVMFKIGFCFVMALVLYPVVHLKIVVTTPSVIQFAIGAAGEICIGAVMGFVVRLLFAGIQLAGELAGFQMGFSIANVLDPMSSTQLPLISELMYMFAIMILLTVNAHHWILRAAAQSFTVIPPFGFHVSGSLMTFLMDAVRDIFVLAIKIGAPVIASLLLISLGIGLVGRTVPQMNVFMVATPVNIIVGIFFFSFSLPMMATYMAQLFDGIGRELFHAMKLIGH